MVVIPCRPGSTLWNRDMWQGRVTGGKTVRASMHQLPLSRRKVIAGWSRIQSGRNPSQSTSNTFI